MKHILLVFIVFASLGSTLLAQKISVDAYEPGEGLVVRTDKYKVRFSGIIQPMVESKYYPDMSNGAPYQRFRMRRMIAKLTGDAGNENISYQLQVDLTGSSDGGGDGTNNNFLMDAWMSWKPTKRIELVVGQDNTPTDSREMGMVSSALQMAERSPVSLAFSTIREFGIFAHTNFKIGRDFVILPSFALTNGDGANVMNKDYGGLKVGGRLDFLPFGKFSNAGQFRQVDMERELTPKLIFGAHYSYNQGISDRRGRQSGTILYQDSLGNTVLPNYQKFGADFLFKYHGFTMSGEYINTNVSIPDNIKLRLRIDGSKATTFLVNGVQDIPNYIKGRIILGSGFNMQAGYLFRNGFSVDGRYSKINPQTFSFLNNGAFYNRSHYYTLCLSKYLGRNYGAKIQAQLTYAKAKTGTETVLGTPMVGNEISGILMVTIAL